MDVFLTGGTGFVGRALTRHLLNAGHRVHRWRRSPARTPAPAGITDLTLPESDAAAWPKALERMDAVIHLVGIISEAGDQTFENVHVALTGRWLEAARAAGVPRWIHMSALGTRPGAASRYHQTKWAAEERVRASGIPAVILRPSLIYGPEDHFTNLFAKLARFLPFLPVMGPGTALIQPVGIEAVAQAFCRAVLLLPDPLAGRTLDLCGPERLSMADLLRLILRVLGRRRALLHLPWPLARAQAATLEFLCGTVLRQPPPLNREQLKMLAEDNVGDGRPADDLFQLRHPALEEGLAAHLARR